MAQFNGSTRVADLLRSQFDVQEPVTVNKLVNVRVTTKDTIPAAGIVSCVESHVNPWTNHVYVPSTLRFGSSDSEMQKKSSQRPKSAKPLSVSNLWNVEGEIKTRPLRKIVKQPITSNNHDARKKLMSNRVDQTTESDFRPCRKYIGEAKHEIPPKHVHRFSQFDIIFNNRNPILMEGEVQNRSHGVKVDFFKRPSIIETNRRPMRRVFSATSASSHSDPICDEYIPVTAGKGSGMSRGHSSSVFLSH